MTKCDLKSVNACVLVFLTSTGEVYCKNRDKLTCRVVVKINEMCATKHHTPNVQKNVSYYFNKNYQTHNQYSGLYLMLIKKFNISSNKMKII